MVLDVGGELFDQSGISGRVRGGLVTLTALIGRNFFGGGGGFDEEETDAGISSGTFLMG